MKKKIQDERVEGTHGSYSHDAEDYSLPPQDPPKIGNNKEEPSIIKKLFTNMWKKKKKDGAL